MTPEESKEARTWLVVHWICFRETFRKNPVFSVVLLAVGAVLGALAVVLKFIF